MAISVLLWVLVGCAAWVVAAALVALVVGRMIKLRDLNAPPGPSHVRSGRPVGPDGLRGTPGPRRPTHEDVEDPSRPA